MGWQNADDGERAEPAADIEIRGRGVRLFLKATDALVFVTFYLAVAILVAMVGLICTEMVLLHLFDRSLLFLDDVVAQLVAVFAFLAIGYCMREHALIRVEVIYNNLGAFRRLFADIVYGLVSLLYVGTLTYYIIELVRSSYANGVRSLSILESPIWIPQAVMAIGSFVLILAIIADMVRQGCRLRALIAEKRGVR